MQTVLITGANGFVGSYLVPLMAFSYKVIATARSVNAKTEIPNIHYQVLDFTDSFAVEEVFSIYQPDVVVHAGAMSKPDDCELNRDQAYNTNVQGTANLLKAANKLKSFFIFLSTDFVFDGQKGMYSEEDATGDPVNYYGKTKLQAEALMQQYAFGWSIVRTVLVYGKPMGGRQNILTVVAERLKAGQGYSVFGDQVRTPTYVEDLTAAIKAVADFRKEGIFHVSGEDIMTPFQMAVATAKHLQLNQNLLKEVDRESFEQPALRPLKTGFAIAKAKVELGYKPISFKEGLNRTFS